MKNGKKGFTLIEIMATIAILAIILIIAVPIYNGVSKNINANIYESKMKEVLAKAESYAIENHAFVFDVKSLIESGVISADNETGIFVDPRTKRDMRCDVINAVYKDNHYEVSITESDTCYNEEELENLYGLVTLKLYNENDEEVKPIEGTDWLREKIVKVRYEFKENYKEYEANVSNVSWIGECEASLSNESTCVIETSEIKNVAINLEITINIGGTEIKSQVEKHVLVDLQNPNVIDGSLVVNNAISTNALRRIEFELSDGNGSGVEYYSIVKARSCDTSEYETNKKTVENRIQSENLDNGTYYICVEDKVGNKALTDYEIKINNVDSIKPTLSDFSLGEYEKGTKYYNKLNLKITVTDEGSSPDKVLYCYTKDDCEPTEVVGLNSAGVATIPFKNASKDPQRVCVIGLDRAGNSSEKKCSDSYYFDNTVPTDIKNTITKDTDYKLNFTGQDKESGIAAYQIYISTNNEDFTLIKRKDGSSFEEVNLGTLKANQTYYIKTVLTNNAGIKGEEITSFKAEYNMTDAITKCSVSNNYCNNGVYIQYGENIFALYRVNSTSAFGVNVSNNMQTSIINDNCCDHGRCIKENVYNTSWSGIYSEDKGSNHTLKVYYDALPTPSTYLNKEDYTFGVVKTLPNGKYSKEKTMKASYGLLDLDEYYAIYNKVYMEGIGTLLSTIYPYCYSSDHYECNNDIDNISGVYASNGSLRTQSAVAGKHHDVITNAAMTVPFKKTLTFKGGSGTKDDPYKLA